MGNKLSKPLSAGPGSHLLLPAPRFIAYAGSLAHQYRRLNIKWIQLPSGYFISLLLFKPGHAADQTA